tara:strand:- start:246 stop:2939 length:2694 start_codon:yes stop_codon:yes gene_type:complete
MKKVILIVVLGLLWCNAGVAGKKKDKAKHSHERSCKYCMVYEKMEDWPDLIRPSAFTYEYVVYPEKMFHKNLKKSKQKQSAAGKKVYQRLVKEKSRLNKYPEHFIRDLAYYEALFNEMLKDKRAKVEKLESIKKGRDSLRASLQISKKAKTSEAVLKYWAVGKLLKKAKIKKKKKKKEDEQKIDLEIIQRASLLAELKNQIRSIKINSHHAVAIEAQKQIDKISENTETKESISKVLKSASNQGTKQLTIDIGTVINNFKEATNTLDAAKTDTGKALDAAIAAVSKSMDFAKESSSKERFTLSMQSLLMTEYVINLVFDILPSENTLDMSKVDFAKDFSSEELAALSNVVGDLAIAKLSLLQRLSGQFSFLDANGFDSIEMMGPLEEKNFGFGKMLKNMAEHEIINLKNVLESEEFNMDKFDSARFAQLTIDKIGMTPTLKDFQTGAMIKSIGVPNVSEKLTLAFTSKELNIASILTNSVGSMIGAISGKDRKGSKTKYLYCVPKELKPELLIKEKENTCVKTSSKSEVFEMCENCQNVISMIARAPSEIDVPENVPNSTGHDLANVFFKHAATPSVPGVLNSSPEYILQAKSPTTEEPLNNEEVSEASTVSEALTDSTYSSEEEELFREMLIAESNTLFYDHFLANELAEGLEPSQELEESRQRFMGMQRELRDRFNELRSDDPEISERYTRYKNNLYSADQLDIIVDNYVENLQEIENRYEQGLINEDEKQSLVDAAISTYYEARSIFISEHLPGYQLPGATVGQFQDAQISINEYINNNDPQNILETSDVLEQVFESRILKSNLVDGERQVVLDVSASLENNLEKAIAVAREQLGEVEFAFVIVDDIGGASGGITSTFVAVEMSEFQEAVGGGDGNGSGDTGSEDSGSGESCPL